MAEDPFDEIDDDYDDREGDPFDRLAGPDDGPPPEETESGGGDSRPLADTDASGTAGSDAAANADPDAPGGAEQDRNVDVAADPFGDVDISRGDPFESADGPFQQVDVDSADPDAVWDRFTEGADPAEATEASLGGEEVAEDAPDVVTVPKGRFCQTCPHFSAPPAATCGHEGTELRTFVGTDEVRVSNCPVVRERRELGETFE